MPAFWRHRRSRNLAIGIGTAVAAVAVIVAFVLVWRATAPHRVSSPPAAVIEEAQPTTESAPASQTAIEAFPATAAVGPTPSTTPTSGPVTPAASAALVAYRLGPNLYVADEDGQNANAVALAPSGDYSLSPDSKTIAVVDGDTKQLVFIDIASRTLVESTIVSGGRPVWMPDSSGVLVATLADVSGATRIQRVSRQGGAPTALGMGGMAAVSPDAGTIVLGPGSGSSAAESAQITVLRGGKSRTVNAPGVVTAVAASNDRVFIGTIADPGAGLWSLPAGGGPGKALIPVAPGGSPYVTLMLSPDARTLAFATGGDDGYSRVSVMPGRGGAPIKLWVRRDDYILQWSSQSNWVYLIEGNAFQGESTSLYRIGRDGHGRRLLVQGASL